MRNATIPPAPTPAMIPLTASPASADTGMPTRSARPIARTTAPGAFGCPDMNASTTNTNGMIARPSASAAPVFGSPARDAGLSVAPATMPASSAQYAGTNNTVATVMAFHFCCGDSGWMPTVRRGMTFIHSPLHRPGRQTAHEVPLQREEDDQGQCHRDERGRGQQLPVFAVRADEARQRDRQDARVGGAAEEHVRDEQVVPHPQELEDRERRERGHRQRDDE